jgi:hypothetical protein
MILELNFDNPERYFLKAWRIEFPLCLETIIMNERRNIKPEEIELIAFLLNKVGLNTDEYPIADFVDEYEGYVMGSIGLGDPEISPYAGDLLQAKYIDSDGKDVAITLTMDENGQLLDLDFWKVDFSKLITYPKPESLFFEDE